MSPYTRIVLVFLLAFVVVSCADDDLSIDPTPSYELEFPEDWEVETPAASAVLVIGTTPDGGDSDSYRESLNLVRENAPFFDLEGYFNANLDALENLFSDFNAISQGKININGREGYELVYALTAQSVQIKNIAHFYVADNSGYVLTASASPETYDEHEAVFRQILGTFKIN